MTEEEYELAKRSETCRCGKDKTVGFALCPECEDRLIAEGERQSERLADRQYER